MRRLLHSRGLISGGAALVINSGCFCASATSQSSGKAGRVSRWAPPPMDVLLPLRPGWGWADSRPMHLLMTQLWLEGLGYTFWIHFCRKCCCCYVDPAEHVCLFWGRNESGFRMQNTETKLTYLQSSSVSQLCTRCTSDGLWSFHLLHPSLPSCGQKAWCWVIIKRINIDLGTHH